MFNGAGIFDRLYSWAADTANNILVRADRMDGEMDGFADGLSNCITRDGQSPWNTNLPAGGFRLINLGQGLISSDSVNYGQVFNSPAFVSPSATASPPNGDSSLLLATTEYVTQVAFSAVLPGQPTGPGRYQLISQGGNASFDIARLPVQNRSTSIALQTADSGNLIDYQSANLVQTFPLSSVVGNGWFVVLKNSTQQDIEIEAPAAVSQSSATSNSIASGTTWVIASGLSIASGDLLTIRRTSDPFNKRIIGTVISYDPPSGTIVASPTYSIGSGATASQNISSITASGTTATLTTAAPHGLMTTESITVTGATPSDYNGTFTITVPAAPASVAISSIAHAGTTATVTTAAPHGLPSGAIITISGATPAAYNGTFTITSSGTTTFTYVMASDPGAAASVVGSYVVLVNTFTYTMLTSPGVNASVVGVYAASANYTDWTITTRPISGAVDGLVSYLMYPSEVRLFTTDGITLRSTVLRSYRFRRSVSQLIIKMPGYGAHFVRLVGGGSGATGGGGGASGTSGVAAGGGGAGGTAGQNGAVLEKVLAAADIPVAPLFTCGAGSAGTAGGTGGISGGASATPGASTGAGGASSFGQSTDITFLQASGGNLVSSAGAGLTNGTGGTPATAAPATTGNLPFNGVINFDKQSANTGVSGAPSSGTNGGAGGTGGTGKAAMSSLTFPTNGLGGAGGTGSGGAGAPGTSAVGFAAGGQGGAGGGGGGGGTSTGNGSGGNGGAGTAGGSGQLEMYGIC